jgi:hypothetical protein
MSTQTWINQFDGAESDLDYLDHHSGLTLDEIPKGKVVCHNPVYPVSRIVGLRGSRAFFIDAQKLSSSVPCDCGWAPEIGTHYRGSGGYHQQRYELAKAEGFKINGDDDQEDDEALREDGLMCAWCDSEPAEIEYEDDEPVRFEVCAKCDRATDDEWETRAQHYIAPVLN